MPTNLDRYKNDLESLVVKGNRLLLAMQAECFPKEITRQLAAMQGVNVKEVLETLPSFQNAYQAWYSETRP